MSSNFGFGGQLGGLAGAIGGGVIGGATVRLLLDDTQFTSSLNRAKTETRTAATTMGKFGAAAKTAFLVGGLAAAAFVKSSVDAYLEHERVLAQLENTIKQMPQLAGETTKAFEDQATALQNLTGYQDEEILSADNVLARFKLTGDQIRQAIPIVADYARFLGTDVPTAASNVAKALLGNTRALKTVGVQFTATGNTAQDFNSILDLMKSKVSGVAETFGKTAAGQFAIAKARLDDVQEEIGKKLVPVLTGLLHAVEHLLPVLSFAADNLGILLGAFLGFKAVTFLPALLRAIAVAAAALKLGGIANEANAASNALASFGGAPMLAVAVGAAGVVVAINEMDKVLGEKTTAALAEGGKALDDYSAKLDAAAGRLHGWLGSVLTFFVPGAKAISDSLDKNKNDLDNASGGWSLYGGTLRTVGGAVRGVTGYLYGEAAAHRAVTNATKAQITEEQILAGGFLGVQSAAAQVAQDQASLNALRRAGKTNTAEYVAQENQAINDLITLSKVSQDYRSKAGGAQAATAAVTNALTVYGHSIGLTTGQIRTLIGQTNAEIARVTALDSKLSALNGKTFTFTVHAVYTQSGATPSPGKPLP